MAPLREAVAVALNAWRAMARHEQIELERRMRLEWVAKRLRCAPDDELEELIDSELANQRR